MNGSHLVAIVLIVAGLISLTSPVLLLRRSASSRTPVIRRSAANSPAVKQLFLLQRLIGAFVLVLGIIFLIL